MKRTNRDLHGAVPEHSRVVLLLVDVINAMDFPTGRTLAKHAAPAARRIAALQTRAREAHVPIVYANDNFGQWRSDFRAIAANAQQPGMPGCKIATLLAPDEHDYFVLKPKHSAFYGTALELLLTYFGAERIVLAGFAGDICVQFTAQDAFLRDYELIVPRDTSASESPASNAAALAFMRARFGAKTPMSARVNFRALSRA